GAYLERSLLAERQGPCPWFEELSPSNKPHESRRRPWRPRTSEQPRTLDVRNDRHAPPGHTRQGRPVRGLADFPGFGPTRPLARPHPRIHPRKAAPCEPVVCTKQRAPAGQ